MWRLGDLSEVDYLFPPCRGSTSGQYFGGKPLYPLSHLVDPYPSTFVFGGAGNRTQSLQHGS